MSEQITMSEEFIKRICATYSMHETLIDAAMTEQRELKMWLAMLKAAMEMSDESSPEFLAMLTRIITHMDNVMDMLKRLHAPAKQASSIMKEHAT